ncbi:hypothetical protein KAR91_73690 [Candidatus Pacearchaeota archaeon]|nr:hypothetical protein [Candidatus Pacearchaeota archaeon]
MTNEELMDLDDLKDYLESICEKLDQIDGTEFGKVENLLGGLAEDANKARRLCDSLIPRKVA